MRDDSVEPLIDPEAMTTFYMELSYDGTNYSGWQIQPNASSIQETLEGVLQQILQERVSVRGSGRTDQGVHARAQGAHFRTKKKVFQEKLLFSLNALLPPDITVNSLLKVSNSFDARKSCVGKVYRYQLSFAPFEDPFTSPYRLHLKHPLDLAAMKKGARYFMGMHDFTSFVNEAGKGAAKKNPVRTVYRISLIEEKEGLSIEFEGEGFLYKMIRNMVGALLDVGRGKIPPDAIEELLALKDRRRAPLAASAKGLHLIEAIYPPHVFGIDKNV